MNAHDLITAAQAAHATRLADQTREQAEEEAAREIDRLALFGADADVRRIALNMDQIEEHDPPPNPAKLTDSRATGYIREHGRSSWELDALEPTLLDRLIEDEIWAWRDADQWETDTDAMERERTLLRQVAGRWDDVTALIEEGGDA